MPNEVAKAKINSIRACLEPYEIVRSGRAIRVLPGVYPTSELSEVMVEAMDDGKFGVHPGECVLDYGTGTGFLAIEAAVRGANVIATDINPAAIQCASINASLHNVSDRIQFRLGTNLQPLRTGETFDIILAGMPWDEGVPADMIEAALFDDGFRMRKALLFQSKTLLNAGGRLIISSFAGHELEHPDVYPPDLFEFRVLRERLIRGVVHCAVLALVK